MYSRASSKPHRADRARQQAQASPIHARYAVVRLIHSAKRKGRDLYAYLRDEPTAKSSVSHVEELLPHRWRQN